MLVAILSYEGHSIPHASRNRLKVSWLRKVADMINDFTPKSNKFFNAETSKDTRSGSYICTSI